MINNIFGNVVWGVLGNYRSMPTDCPQRDERQGWLGDRAIGSKGESFLFDIHALYRKWMNDIRDSQTEAGSIPDVVPTYWKIYNDNTTWAGTYVILADMLCTQYGDSDVVRVHYPPMKKWMDYMTQLPEGRAHDQGHVRRLVRAAGVARPDPFRGSQTDDARGTHRYRLFLS